jgi:hypothetical protein
MGSFSTHPRTLVAPGWPTGTISHSGPSMNW